MSKPEEKRSFSKFGKHFQEELAHIILEERPFADQLEEVLDPGFFELAYVRTFAELIFDYRKRYHVHPSQEIMASIIRTQMNHESELVQEQVRNFFARMSATEVADREFVKTQSLDFCKKQKLNEALLKSAEMLNFGSHAYDDIEDVLKNAFKLGVDNDFGHDFKTDFELRYAQKARNAITTGWGEIDAITGGGLGIGELGVVIAPTGYGKSQILVYLGTQALLLGKNVVYYTLELSETVVGQRFDSCVTGVPLDDLKNEKDVVGELVQKVRGQLKIKQYPPRIATTATIRHHLDKLKARGWMPDLIIIDYGDLLKPLGEHKEKVYALEAIYEDMRSIAIEYCIQVWTASQTNRSGLNAEVITMESIADAYAKCFPADFIFSLSRTMQEKQTNSGKIFIAKSRLGRDGYIFPILMDTARIKISVLPAMSAEELQATVKEHKDEEQLANTAALRDAFLKFQEKAKKGL